uniref:Uncharacterized protein n=2 Tax=Phaeomonas parva TaxID=124430 RepID=A0A7S1TXJ9_9STRA
MASSTRRARPKTSGGFGGSIRRSRSFEADALRGDDVHAIVAAAKNDLRALRDLQSSLRRQLLREPGAGRVVRGLRDRVRAEVDGGVDVADVAIKAVADRYMGALDEVLREGAYQTAEQAACTLGARSALVRTLQPLRASVEDMAMELFRADGGDADAAGASLKSSGGSSSGGQYLVNSQPYYALLRQMIALKKREQQSEATMGAAASMAAAARQQQPEPMAVSGAGVVTQEPKPKPNPKDEAEKKRLQEQLLAQMRRADELDAALGEAQRSLQAAYASGERAEEARSVAEARVVDLLDEHQAAVARAKREAKTYADAAAAKARAAAELQQRVHCLEVELAAQGEELGAALREKDRELAAQQQEARDERELAARQLSARGDEARTRELYDAYRTAAEVIFGATTTLAAAASAKPKAAAGAGEAAAAEVEAAAAFEALEMKLQQKAYAAALKTQRAARAAEGPIFNHGRFQETADDIFEALGRLAADAKTQREIVAGLNLHIDGLERASRDAAAAHVEELKRARKDAAKDEENERALDLARREAANAKAEAADEHAEANRCKRELRIAHDELESARAMNISLRSKLERLSNAKKQIRAADYTDTFEEVLTPTLTLTRP